MKEYIINSAQEMKRLASTLADQVTGGEVWLLEGELGAGKTTFVQGLAKALGIKQKVTSPTFTIVSEYRAPDGAGIRRLVHVDLYRLSKGAAKLEPAVQDALAQADEGALVAVEWAEKLGGEELEGVTRIKFKHGGKKTERLVTIKQ